MGPALHTQYHTERNLPATLLNPPRTGAGGDCYVINVRIYHEMFSVGGQPDSLLV